MVFDPWAVSIEGHSVATVLRPRAVVMLCHKKIRIENPLIISGAAL